MLGFIILSIEISDILLWILAGIGLIKIGELAWKHLNIKGVNEFLENLKKYIIPIVLVLLLLVSVIAPIVARYYGFFNKDRPLQGSDLLGFYGAVIGGVVTVLGVYWTLKHENEKSKEERRESSLPIFTFSINLNSENNSNSYHDNGSFVFGSNLKDEFEDEDDKLRKSLEKYSQDKKHLKEKRRQDLKTSVVTHYNGNGKKTDHKINEYRRDLNELDENLNKEINKQKVCNLGKSFILRINNIGLQSAILSTIKFIPKGIMSSYNESEIINIDYLSVPKGETTELKFIFDWYFKNQNGLSTEFQEAGDLELKYTDLYSNPYEYNIPIKIKREIAQDKNEDFIEQFNIIIDKERLPVRPKGYS